MSSQNKNPLGLDIEILKETFNALSPSAEKLVELFYQTLFKDFPELKKLFKNTDMDSQRKKLMDSLVFVIKNLDHPESLAQGLKHLGIRHADYQVKPNQYEMVGKSLLKAMAELAGELWTARAAKAWQKALTAISTIMIDAASQPKPKLSEEKISMESNKDKILENNRLVNSILDNANVNIIMADINEDVIFLNKASQKAFNDLESELKKGIPGFNPNKIMGNSIHVFHKDPEPIKRTLRALRPGEIHRAYINPGNLSFELKATALFDEDGEKVGYCTQWRDVTTELKTGAIVDSISKAQAMIEFEMDGTVVTANQNFLSAVGYSLDEIKGKHHRMFVSPEISSSAEYISFWEKLNRGEFDAGEYKRVAKGGKEVWLQASYNPVLDPNGRPIKVVKFAMDITDKKLAVIREAEELRAYSKEAAMVIDRCKEGDLSARGNVDKMSETYRPMLEGINTVIEVVVNPIREINAQLNKISEGDLTAYVVGEYKGDHASLKNAMNKTLDSLNEILNQVKTGSDQIAQGSNEVASNAQSLSQGATEQASSLEEITASMTELSGQTKQNAENAQMANQLASQARSNAEGGNQQMQNMVNAMSDISESSKNISKIIKVIDEIAFQTNLLALNAAVEAARAGVHGKGFAVVAEEVRNLAARSAKAAKETTDLIENSKGKVNVGTEIANQTSTALQEIVGSIGKVSDLVGEIAAASNEQSQGINQVNQGLSQLDSVTQQNTASAEESAAAAEELSAQTIKLQDMLKKFVLKEIASAMAMPNLSPEMIQAFQEFMKQHNGGSSISPSKPHAYSSVGNGKPSSKKLNPKEIINLDDSEFGKY